MQVAKTILQQLGSSQFIAMTGSKNFIGGQNSLSMHLTKNKAKAKYLTIILDSTDTYTMKFQDVKLNVVSQESGLYCDMIRKHFENVTGLYTKLY